MKSDVSAQFARYVSRKERFESSLGAEANILPGEFPRRAEDEVWVEHHAGFASGSSGMVAVIFRRRREKSPRRSPGGFGPGHLARKWPRAGGECEFERDGSAMSPPPAITTSKFFSSFSMPRLWHAAQKNTEFAHGEGWPVSLAKGPPAFFAAARAPRPISDFRRVARFGP